MHLPEPAGKWFYTSILIENAFWTAVQASALYPIGLDLDAYAARTPPQLAGK